MSRSGYSEDLTSWELICWRGAVTKAIKGKRGQILLKELLAYLDGMETKELIANNLQVEGQYCALGCVGSVRGLDMSIMDVEDYTAIAGMFNIAESLAREIMFVNDELADMYTMQGDDNKIRYKTVRNWVVANILPEEVEQ